MAHRSRPPSHAGPWAIPWLVITALAVGPVQVTTAQTTPPRVLVPGFDLQEVASAPTIVTPVAIAFDHQGQLLVIESHTHQRPDDYAGPTTDRIQRLIDDDRDGRTDRVETYFEGTAQTMSLLPGPDDWMYVATRREVFRIRDLDHDGRAETRESLVRLETAGDYPHNGLAGLAFAPDGRLVFGLGENLGEAYRLIGADGGSLSGGGEGGSVLACRADGRQLERIARGFWNPFGNCFDPEGRLFSVDNDPDASPPCRLLHVVPRGDYGYQFRFGRSGRHPLQAWDAELPGTLPMAAGTGEAPCQVVPYRGRLWVTSWGDFRIEAYAMRTVGASCQAQGEIIVQGDARFRPVGLAAAADGSLYFSDWVDRSYPVHGEGRIWRLIPTSASPPSGTFPELSAAERRADSLRGGAKLETLLTAADEEDPFLHQAASAGLASSEGLEAIDFRRLSSPRQRQAVLEAMLWNDPSGAFPWLDRVLDDRDDAVCILGLRLIAETRSLDYRQRVADLLSRRQPLTARLGAVALATLAWLDEGDESKDLGPLHRRLADLLESETTPLTLRQLALRSLPQQHEALSPDRLTRLLKRHPDLGPEVVGILAEQADVSAGRILADIATSPQHESSLRADACAALAAHLPAQASVLQSLRRDTDPSVRLEAERNLRVRPTSADSAPVSGELFGPDAPAGDPAAGRRVFFRSLGARCSSCHRYDGRGADIGPELTTIGRRANREWLLETIVDPNRDVAPRYATTTVITTDGRTLTGLLLPGPGDDAAETFVEADGTRVTVPLEQIEARHYHTRSLMPEGLGRVLGADELRDLIAFLLAPPG